ncbi:MAG: hypothetical protein ACK5U8_08955 [Deltaproteobacteria bacterium]
MVRASTPLLSLCAAWLGSAAAWVGCDCAGAGAPSDAIDCSDALALSEPRTIGRVSFRPEGRAIVVEGIPAVSRWAVGRGPALATEPFAPALDAIEALEPDAVLVLGDFGAGPRLEEFVASLADLSVPVLLVPGPRDRLEDLRAALARHEASNVLSLAGTHVVRLGALELVIASGSVDSRYVLEGGCRLEDLEGLLDEGSQARLRVLVGFDAPAGTALTAGLDGGEAGSARVRAAMDEAGVAAGIFAGPETRVGVWMSAASVQASAPAPDLRVIVAPLVGPALETADGTRAPTGPLLVVFGPSGVGPASLP